MRRERLQQATVAAAALLTYANSLANRFAVDDDFIIVYNPRVHELADQAAIWLTPYWPAYGEQLGLYRPLAIFAYAVQWAAGGGAPWLFHLVSVLLHAGVSLLVLALLRRVGLAAGALFGALLFAVHPVHTEVVANVVGQAELLAALAVVGACVVYAARPPDRALTRARTLVLLLLFALGLLAKEGAIVLPALLVAIDAAQGRIGRGADGRLRAPGLFGTLAGLGAVAAGWFLLRQRVLGSVVGSDAAPWLPFLRSDDRIWSALRVWPEYLRLMVFPVDLSADYSPGVLLPADGPSAVVVLGGALLVAVTALAVLTPRRPNAGLPAAWFLISVLPVSNLLFPIGVLMAERLLYLPSVALALAGAALVAHARVVIAPVQRQTAAAIAVLVIVLLGARTVIRNPDWRDSAAYYHALLRDHPESYRAQWGEAARRLSHGDRAGAHTAMALAWRIWPHDPQLLNEFALLHIWDHAYARAVPLLEQSTGLNDRARHVWINLSYVYLGVGRGADAEAAAQRAAALGANRSETGALTAQSFELRARWQDALQAWQATVAVETGRTWTYWSALARALARADRPADAVAAADTARLLAPETGAGQVDALRAAIALGCYAGATVSKNAECADPLADWAIITAVNALPPDVTAGETARAPSQGSTHDAASSPAPAARPGGAGRS